MPIVNSFDLFGISFLKSDFLFLRMSYRKCYCRWSINPSRPSFGQQDIHSCSAPGYFTPKGDDSCAPFLGWLSQYFLMGLSRKKYRKRQKKGRKQTEKYNFLALSDLVGSSNKVSVKDRWLGFAKSAFRCLFICQRESWNDWKIVT